jgi:hypothetical protein
MPTEATRARRQSVTTTNRICWSIRVALWFGIRIQVAAADEEEAKRPAYLSGPLVVAFWKEPSVFVGQTIPAGSSRTHGRFAPASQGGGALTCRIVYEPMRSVMLILIPAPAEPVFLWRGEVRVNSASD